jgi:hypothetical protein
LLSVFSLLVPRRFTDGPFGSALGACADEGPLIGGCGVQLI